MRKVIPPLLKLPLIILAVYAVLMIALFLFQRRMIYFPATTVGDLGPGCQAVVATTTDGLSLQGWVQAGKKPTAGAVICLHGNGGNRSYYLPDMSLFAGPGFDVFSFDWRGYGGNPGSPSEAGLYADGEAMLAAVQEKSGLAAKDVVLMGRSLGCAVAVELAKRHRVKALILLSPFTSLPDTAADLYWWAPVRFLLKDRYDSLAKAGEIDVPVLVIAGEADRLVSAAQSKRLAKAFPHGRILLLPGVGHNNIFNLAGREMAGRVREFLASLKGS